MNYILDTHTFIWMCSDVNSLSKNVISILEDENTNLFLSAATTWEINIKEKLGKLQFLKFDLQTAFQEFHLNELPIKILHTIKVKDLKSYHKDPFDRILIAQSQIESMPLLSKDKMFDKYKVKRIW